MQRLDEVNQVNAEYLERLYEQYLREPRSVDANWQSFFAGLDAAAADAATPAKQSTIPLASKDAPTDGSGHVLTMGVHNLVHSYREFGHFVAKLDPLGHDRPSHPLLDLSQFNMSPADLDRQVGTGGFLGRTDGTLRDLIDKLKLTYCRTIGVEYQQISDKAQRDWLAQAMEPSYNRPALPPEELKGILFQLVASEEFERFLHTRFVGAKRFSLEGAEALIPLMNTLIDDAAGLGVEEVCMGMAHRGRLNVLAHVLNKPYEVIFGEFAGTNLRQESEGDGDVKYHLGYANDRPATAKGAASNGKKIHLSLSPNPSHLELIDPVVEGIVRCKQKVRGDKDHSRVVPVLIHGDAAFAGQGIVHETLGLSELSFYRTGGTIHIIVNNQIGFTTSPSEGRFTPYPTDVAKMVQAPIFHVNGDDPEAVVHAARLAIAFRQRFKCDVMIDLWCYRRHGHNEADEPGFTQPVMYREIQAHRSVRDLFGEQVAARGIVEASTLESMSRIPRERMDSAANLAQEYRPRQRTATMNHLWKGMTRTPGDFGAKTTVARDVLLRIAQGVNKLPPDFTPHPKLIKQLQGRVDAVKAGQGIDWACGEMLAMGSLLLEGTPIRFTGQDVQRGTFSHRHAVLNDFNTGKPYTPLNFLSKPPEHAPENVAGQGTNGTIRDNGAHARFLNVPGEAGQAHLTIINTMLSELAVVGFEYGFSSADPRNLVVWEAQFGDFVNMAQPIIDQFIAAAESKWQLMNGLVMLLPHGYEGQGPEHSNAYIERFLSLCAEDNLQVCVPSTPGNYFHMLRRQIHRKVRKPLICMMPKALLRFAPSFSKIEEFADANLQLVIDDPAQPERDRVRRVLFCSGKVFYSLSALRDKEAMRDVAIVRVEQLYPFPRKEIQQVLAKYRQAREIAWVQEEPRNRGAWSFMEPLLRQLLPDPAVLTYFGRDAAASPAAGSMKMHEVEERELLAHALELPVKDAKEAAKEDGGKALAAKDSPAAGAAATTPAVRDVAAASPAKASNGASVSS